MAKRNALGEIKKGKKEFITIRKLLNDLAGRIVPGPNFCRPSFMVIPKVHQIKGHSLKMHPCFLNLTLSTFS